MKSHVQPRKTVQAQTLVIFAIGIGVMALLCGFAIDSGLLYLAKARLSRAVDGAALSAVGNFSEVSASSDPSGALNRDAVATIMRNFAIANYPDLSSISTTAVGGTPSGGTQGTYVNTSGQNYYQYTYIFADTNPGTGGADPNANPPYRRYVEVILQTGAGNQITSGQCAARCPAHTYFMGVIPAFADLKVSSSAVATRNPRLIMVVVDRSASMLSQSNGALGGAFGLPAAITTFLNFFDTSSDYVGLVSFGSSARLEMPLTTNFLEAGTNDLYDSYQIDNDGYAIPGVDPEEYTNYNNFTTNDVRRMKFGGQTAADEGLRMALEQLMQNPGYTNPNVVKYIVLFTDGAWNTVRTMVAAPGYTNVFSYPTTTASPNPWVASQPWINYYFSWSTYGNPIGTVSMPFLSPYPDFENSQSYAPAFESQNGFDYQNHKYDVWQSADGVNEPVSTVKQIIGAPMTISNNTTNSYGQSTGYLFTWPAGAQPLFWTTQPTQIYSQTANVWLQPGAVDYLYTNGVSTPLMTIVSDYTNPSMTTNVTVLPGESNVLVVPGYVCEGIISDSLDMAYPDNAANGGSSYPRYRDDGYSQPFMWPDETNTETTISGFDAFYYGSGGNPQVSGSPERQLMFRNYANLLTGYYVIRPDDPAGTSVEPLTGATRPLYGNGAYYPGSGFYWPFDLVGIDQWPNFSLRNATSSSDPNNQGYDRFIAYSINMLSTNAAPEYAGELFYQGTSGTNVLSGTTAVSSQITSSSSWQSGEPSWFSPFSSLMTNETSHFPTNIGGAIWRPMAFNGSNANLMNQNYVGNTNDASLTSEVNLAGNSATGGYVQDGTGRIFKNVMAYSGRPTHYYDFSRSSWEPIPDNHDQNLALGLGNWKALEYAWHARAAGVTIYTVGYGGDVNSSEQVLLAQVANATNSTGASTGMLYNANQPIGEQFYATTTTQISNDFYLIGTAINVALTQ
jgi:Flp pilus assembly protein TadG